MQALVTSRRAFNPAHRFAKQTLDLRRVNDRKTEFGGQRRQFGAPDRREGEDGWKIMSRTLPENT